MQRRRGWTPFWIIMLFGLGLGVFAEESFRRDKVIVTRGRTPYVPLDNPKWVAARSVSYLAEGELVLGLNLGGEQRAYPLRLMAWHHIANDRIGPGRRPVAVVY